MAFVAERDPASMLSARMESRLFAALDSETDSAIARQLKATLKTLLWEGCPSCPSYWLKICSNVVLAAGQNARALSNSLSGLDSRGDEGGLMADVGTDFTPGLLQAYLTILQLHMLQGRACQ